MFYHWHRRHHRAHQSSDHDRGQDGAGDTDRRQARDDFFSFGRHHHGLFGERGFGRGGRLGRLFAHGDLHLVILHLIAGRPRHGYEIIKAIEEMAGGSYSPSPGTVYPALTMLEEQGYIRVEAAEGSKKLYAVTEDGRAYLDANRQAVAALLARVEKAGAARGANAAPGVVRAIENLKVALRLRTGRGALSGEEAEKIAAILDRAAAEIERS